MGGAGGGAPCLEVLLASGCLPWDRTSRDVFRCVMRDPASTARWLVSRFGPREGVRRALLSGKKDVLAHLPLRMEAPMEVDVDDTWEPATVIDKVLALAAHDDDERMVLLALEAGADANGCDGWPMGAALSNGNAGIVRALLAAGADPRRRYLEGLSDEIARVLLDAGVQLEGGIDSDDGDDGDDDDGAQPDDDGGSIDSDDGDDSDDDDGEYPACQYSIASMVYGKKTIKIRVKQLDKAMALAAQTGQLKIVEAMLCSRFSFDLSAALYESARAGHDGVTRLLKTHMGPSEILEAFKKAQSDVFGRCGDVLRALIRTGSRAQDFGDAGVNVVFRLCSVDLLRTFVEHGVDVRDHGRVFLESGAPLCDPEFLQALFDAGVDVRRSSQTLAGAIQSGRVELLQVLLSNGADVRQLGCLPPATTDDQTALRQILRMLGEAGADVRAIITESLRTAYEKGAVLHPVKLRME